MRSLMMTAAFVAATATGAGAASYIESDFGGDVSGNLTVPTSVGALSAGTHTFTGSNTCTDKSSFSDLILCNGDNWDYWGLDILPGFTLTSVSATVSNFTGASGDKAFMRLFGPGITSLGNRFLSADGSTGELLGADQGPGNGYVLQSLTFEDADTFRGYSFDYVWTVTVDGAPEVVPLPATALLLLGGLGGLAALKRRRRR